MKLPELALLYSIVGLGAAAAQLFLRRGSALDSLLLLLLWPLYGPFLLMQPEQAEAQGSVAARAPSPTTLAAPDDTPDLLAPLRAAGGAPVAALLPDKEAGRALYRRLQAARDRIGEIDELLEQERFDLQAAELRLEELTAREEDRAARSAERRVLMIRQLHQLRQKSRRQIEEVQELLAQLHVQAELVRLTGAEDEARGLVEELCDRVDELDALLEIEEQLAIEPARAAI